LNTDVRLKGFDCHSENGCLSVFPFTSIPDLIVIFFLWR